MFVLKQIPEDFKVFEDLEYDLSDNGNFALYLVKKKSYNTFDIISRIANFLHLKNSDVGFCGNKDRNAVTEQYITVPRRVHSHLESFKAKDIELKFVGFVSDRLNLGDLDSNLFEIVVRNLDSKIEIDSIDMTKVPNYFGPQRFGKNNAQIGRAMIKGDFKSAVNLAMESSEYSEEIKEKLFSNPNEFVGSLQIIPKKILKLYIHAYQSDLWNRAVKEYVSIFHDSENIQVPIIGFATRLSGDIGKVYDKILRQERLSERDFIIRQIKDLSSEGDLRSLYIDISNFSFEFLKDKLNSNKEKCVLKFKLGKGSYATTLISFLFLDGFNTPELCSGMY